MLKRHVLDPLSTIFSLAQITPKKAQGTQNFEFKDSSGAHHLSWLVHYPKHQLLAPMTARLADGQLRDCTNKDCIDLISLWAQRDGFSRLL